MPSPPLVPPELAHARAALVHGIAMSVTRLATNLEAAAPYLQGPDGAELLADMRTGVERARVQLAKLEPNAVPRRERRRVRSLHHLSNAVHILAAGVPLLFWYLPVETVFLAKEMEEELQRMMKVFRALRNLGNEELKRTAKLFRALKEAGGG